MSHEPLREVVAVPRVHVDEVRVQEDVAGVDRGALGPEEALGEIWREIMHMSLSEGICHSLFYVVGTLPGPRAISPLL